MNNVTAAEINTAMDFAYGMGLKQERTNDDYESAMSFAYSMGLKKVEKTEKAPRRKSFSSKLVFASLF